MIISKTPLRNGNCPIKDPIAKMGVAHTMGLGLLDGPNQQIINNFSLFQKILAQYGFHSENIFLKKKNIKKLQFSTFLFPYM